MFPKFQMDSQQAPNNVPYYIPYIIWICSTIAIYFAQIHMYKSRQQLLYFGTI